MLGTTGGASTSELSLDDDDDDASAVSSRLNADTSGSLLAAPPAASGAVTAATDFTKHSLRSLFVHIIPVTTCVRAWRHVCRRLGLHACACVYIYTFINV